jgi:hypothetical protein
MIGSLVQEVNQVMYEIYHTRQLSVKPFFSEFASFLNVNPFLR